MQTVETKFLGPTDSRGSRVKAKAEAGSVTLSWDHALGLEENHDAAARALIVKLEWTEREWVRGSAQNGSGYVYVQVCEWTRLSLEVSS